MAPTSQVPVASENNSGYNDGKPATSVRCKPQLLEAKTSIRGLVAEILAGSNPEKAVIKLGLGDASVYPSFRKGQEAFSQAVADAVTSAKFDSYAPSYGFSFARQ